MGIALESSTQVFQNVTQEFALSDFSMAIYYGGGVSAEDYDNDGDLDLAISSHIWDDARILRNEVNAGYTEIFFSLNFHSRASLWLDYDGDHLLDLFFAGDCLGEGENCQSPWALFKQLPDGTFEDVTSSAGLANIDDYSTEAFGGMSAGDINSDGYLDIVAGHFRGPAMIFTNQRDGTFKVEIDPYDFGEQKLWQSVILDFDGDGFEDIYQAVDFQQPNQFWKHNGDGEFVDRAEDYGLDHRCDDMGIALGDYDLDGDMDIYISCIESKSRETDETVQGSDLLRNDNFNFSGIGIESGVSDVGWGWGVTFIDGNKDGFPDLAGTNGLLWKDQSKYFLNEGGSGFVDISEQVNFNDSLMATGLISLDFDRDGDLDMIQTYKSSVNDYPLVFLENSSNFSDRNYVVVKPRMSGPNHWAIGAMVKIVTSNWTQVKPITAGISTYGQEPAEAFFGLGDATIIDEIEVVWPGGGVSRITDVQPNQIITIDDTDALHPPMNLSVESDEANSLRLSWDVYSEVDSYRLERSEDADFESFETILFETEDTQYVDTALDNLKRYYYRLSSVRGNENSRFSLIKSAFTSGIEVLIPANLDYQVISINGIRVLWEDLADNETSYRIQRSGDRSFSSFVEVILPENSNSYLDDGLEPGGQYYYRIQAYNSEGISEFSEVLSVKVDYVAPLAAYSSEGLEIYPNPSGGYFSIKSNNSEILRLTISDVSGRIVSSEIIRSSFFKSSRPLEAGIYFLEIDLVNKETRVHKLIIR